jgi:phosphoribosyl 1,2-cyclic phosphodiesterase
MKITFFGTGSAFNHDYGNNAALLEFSNTNLLLDCGYSVPRYLEEKIKIGNINNIWVSHMHADHIGGLEEIAFKNKFMYGGKKANLIVHEYMYQDLINWLQLTLKWTTKGVTTVDDYFNVVKMNSDTVFGLEDEEFMMVKVGHIGMMPAFMLIGRNFVYTGDCKFVDWTKANLEKINYIFQDTQLATYGDDVHTTLDQLLTLPLEIRKKIYCMHYGSNIDEMQDKILKAGMKIVKSYNTIELK